MSLTDNGISTTTELDSFKWQQYSLRGKGGGIRTRIQWEYRDKSGALHSGVTHTLLDACMAARLYGYSVEEDLQ